MNALKTLIASHFPCHCDGAKYGIPRDCFRHYYEKEILDMLEEHSDMVLKRGEYKEDATELEMDRSEINKMEWDHKFATYFGGNTNSIEDHKFPWNPKPETEWRRKSKADAEKAFQKYLRNETRTGDGC